MRQQLLYERRDNTGALTTLSVSFGYSGRLVFNEGTYFPKLAHSESREVDEYLIIDAAQIPILATALRCPGAEGDALLDALAAWAAREGIRTLRGVERWCARHQIRAGREEWISRD